MGTILTDPSLSQIAQRVVVIEDSDDDYEALTRSFEVVEFMHPVVRTTNAEDCLTLLEQVASLPAAHLGLPALILLDLNLPGMTGAEFLHILKSHELLKIIPVIVYTTSNNPADVQACLALHANAYHTKQMDLIKMEEQVRSMVEYWFEHALLVSPLRGHRRHGGV